MPKLMPGALFCEVFGEYVPRFCVDTAVIGPDDRVRFRHMNGFIPFFRVSGPHGVALKARSEEPRRGQFGLPGGTVFKGETVEEASRRIIKSEFGLEIDVLGEIGLMEFPNEHRVVRVDDVEQKVMIDSKSVVLIARARTAELKTKPGQVAGWFQGLPPVIHEYHTPFLVARGLLL